MAAPQQLHLFKVIKALQVRLRKGLLRKPKKVTNRQDTHYWFSGLFKPQAKVFQCQVLHDV